MNTELSAEHALIASMSSEIIASLKDANGFLTVAGIRPHTQAHYANTETGENGIADLISSILRTNKSIFPALVGETELRQVAIANSMFTDEIMAEVERQFSAGSTRYRVRSVRNYLSTYMFRSGKIGKIQLTGLEDTSRTCPKPRCKWFLAQ
jgi:hypothetical protein